MNDALIDTTMVAKFGREKTQHGYRVTIIGNEADGYRVQTQTKCGRVFDDTTKLAEGVVSCPSCDRADLAGHFAADLNTEVD